MILIQISLTVIVILYWVSIPAMFVHSWMEKILADSPHPFKYTIKNTNWFFLVPWIIIGLFITGGVIELWKI